MTTTTRRQAEDEINPPLDAQAGRLNTLIRLAYGSGDVACNVVFGMASTLLALFYTDYAGVPPITVGAVMFFSRIFDGFSDVIMGQIVFKTQSRFGQSRPWILRMAFPFALSAVLLFTVPQTTASLQFWYIFITYNFCTTVCYTAINLPYGSLLSMMSRDAKERELLSVFRMAMSPIGRIISVSLTLPFVKLFGDDQRAWVISMSIWAGIALVLLLFCFAYCKETVHIPGRESQRDFIFRKNVGALVRNNYFWAVLVLWGMQGTSQTVTGTIMPYYCKYIFQNETWMYSSLYFMETVTIIISIIFCPLLRRFASKRNCIAYGAVVVLLSQCIFMLAPHSFPLCVATTILRGIGQAPLSAFVFSMLGDAVEFGQWKTRVRQESFVFSGGSVGTKVGMGASQALITAYMTYSGYLASTGATVAQPQSALDAIVNIYLIGPILVWLIVLVVCWFYWLDDKYPSIMEELFEREKRGEL
ncbi:MAG: MFS transporter [Planctomycetaceae bacterium]|nr:MFS transporter [Planctomycetaceae bacterium]